MKFQDDISNMNTYIHTFVRTYIRTSRNQYVPFFFKVGGINTENSNIVLLLFGCALTVAMATMCFNLQSVLLLSHNIHDVHFKNDDERYPYQSLKFAKN